MPIRSLILLLFFLVRLLSGQTANFLKTFTPTAAYSSTTSYVITGMWAQGIATMSPSSFVLGGFYSRYSNLAGDTLTQDSYMIKNLTDGLTKWFRKYHLAKQRMMFYDVGVKYNKDIIAVGSSNGMNNQQNPDGILLTTDSNGYLKSLRIYPKQSISKVTVLKDKKIAILTADSNLYIKLVLLDKDCNLIWSKRLFNTDISCCYYSGYELIEGINKSLLVVGMKFFNYSTTYTWHPFAMLCDSNGNKINDIIVPINASQFLSAGNNFNEGFYLVGSGVNSSNNTNLTGHLLKVNNQLQLDWYKLYECNITHVEFTDLILYSRNNVSILTEPEPPSSWSRRAGFTFMDSLGIIRKSFLYNPINTDQYPDKMLPIQNGKVLFTLYSNAGRLFGVTDTIPSGFCNTDTLTWTINSPSISVQYNNLALINSPFNYVKDTAYVYTPKDAELLYVCSTGPTAPLDTINYPPPPPPPPSTLTSIKNSFDDEDTEDRFLIQPNPVADYLIITTNRYPKFPVEIRVINSEGKLMMYKELFNYIFPFKIDVINFPRGLYILSIKTLNSGLYKSKFIVFRE